jgi:acetoin utilization deacetylase AcuC-like enzyme
MNVGLVYDPIYLEHDTGEHVENSVRLSTTLELLAEKQIKQQLFLLPPRPATGDEIGLVHAREYIFRVRDFCENGGSDLDSDTRASTNSFKSAVIAAGGTITAVEAVMNRTVKYSFALVRPPGHHATTWHAKGFCIFNNIAIAAKWVLTNYDIDRILIVDFDVHHGNGTQDAFYLSPSVLYFSTHQYPLYPGSGNLSETGARRGLGYTVNIPMVAGWGDEEYQAVYEDILAPIARRYKPQLIMVSAGYDAHWADNISMMRVSVPGFVRITQVLKVLADKLCDGKLMFVLEGGYNPTSLSYSVAASLNVLLGHKDFEDPLGKRESRVKFEDFDKFIKVVKEKHDIQY